MPALNGQETVKRAALAGAAILLVSIPAGASEYRTVRKTTGSVTISGWENTLIKGNPNLRHFQWHPITSNVQGREPVRPVKKPDKIYIKGHPARRAKSVYEKPKHIPTIIHKARSSNQYVHAGLPDRNLTGDIHYKHIPLPERNTETSLSYQHAGLPERTVEGNVYYKQASLPARDVAGRIHYKHIEPGHYVQDKLQESRVSARLDQKAPESEKASPEVLSYSDVYGKLRSCDTDAHLYARDVYGSIKGARPF